MEVDHRKNKKLLQNRLHQISKDFRDDIAIVTENGNAISNGQLNDQAVNLANKILEVSKAYHEFIGILSQRNIGMVVSMIAILEHGAAYIPVDPTFPKERQSYIFNHSKCKVLIMDLDTYDIYNSISKESEMFHLPVDFIFIIDPIDGSFLRLIVRENSSKKIPLDAPLLERSNNERQVAYVLYTSGSTGNPKGVLVYHDSVLNIIDWFAQDLKISTFDKVLGLTTFCFDISVLEIFMPLLYGATLVLASSRTQKDPFRIIEIIDEFEVTIMQATPTTFEMCLATNWQGRSRLNLLCGGEAFRPSLKKLARSCKSFRNVYGPTETTIWSSSYLIPKDIDTESKQALPIGAPISDTQFYLVDENGMLKADGEEGELCIGGIGVAKGYIFADELTKERFFPNPFGNKEGFIYKTGDLVKRLEDGNYLYLNRMDDQVKLNGYRIELGEVESVIMSYELVKQAVVLIENEKRMVAFVQLYDPSKQSFQVEQDILKFSASKLTKYMVPSCIRFVLDFPKTPNGKLDKKSLMAQVLDQNVSTLEPNASDLDTTSSAKLGTKSPFYLVLYSIVYNFLVKVLFEPTGTKVFIAKESDILTTDKKKSMDFEQTDCLGSLSLDIYLSKIIHSFSGKTIKPNESLVSFGIDSLSSVIFVQQLKSNFENIKISPSQLFNPNKTLKAFAFELEEDLNRERPGLLEKLKIVPMTRDLESCDVDSVESITDPYIQMKKDIELRILNNRFFLEGIRGLLALWVYYDHFGSPKLAYRKISDTLLFIMMSGFTTGLQAIPSHGKSSTHSSSSESNWKVSSFLFYRFIGLFPIYWLVMLLSIPKVYVEYPFGNFNTTQFAGLIVMDVFCLQTWTKWSNDVFGDLFYTGVLWNLFLVYAAVKSTSHSQLKPLVKYVIYFLIFTGLLLVEVFEFGYRTPATYMPFFLFGLLMSKIFFFIAKKLSMTKRVGQVSQHFNNQSFKSVEAAGDQPEMDESLHNIQETIQWKSAIFQFGPDFLFILIVFSLVWNHWHLNSSGNYTFNIFMLNLGYPVLVGTYILWSMMQYNGQRSLSSRFICENKITILLGECSYAMYILQLLIVNFYIRVFIQEPEYIAAVYLQEHFYVYKYDWGSKQTFYIRIMSFFVTLAMSILVQKIFQDKIITFLVSKFTK